MWKQEMDIPRSRRRDMMLVKVAEVTNQKRCDVDIYEGEGTLLVKILLDFPLVLTELNGIFGLSDTIAISKAKDDHDAVVSIFFDLDVKYCAGKQAHKI